MCRIAVHLEYGLTVNALSLAHAARRWNNSKPARVALDMICQRRNLGTLHIGFAPPAPQRVASSAIELVPIEVWQLVKQQLTASTVRDALQAFLQPIRDFCGGGSQSPHPPTESLAECESCLYDVQYSLACMTTSFPPTRTSIACWPTLNLNASRYSWLAETTGLVST